MENENLELDVKPAGNKDLWLFLIIVDIIFLCVFGFFLYKHFSARIFDAAPRIEQTETVELPEAAETDVLVAEQAIAVESVAAEPSVQPVEIPVTAVIEREQKKEEAKEAQKAAQDKKESVVVQVNPKSRYRRVTFRWYGDGDKVAIVSGFTMVKPQALKKRGDHWETTLSIAPGTYKFLYVIDGKNTPDPYSEEKDGRSVVVVN